MDNILPILVASAVVLLVFGAVQALMRLTNSDRRRLHQRLHADAKASGGPAPLAVRRTTEVQGVARVLVRFGPFRAIHRRLIQANPDANLGNFLALSAALAVGVALVLWLVANSPVMALLGGAAGGYVPYFLLGSKRARRQRALAAQLPEALDFLGRILRAGHSFTTGLQMMSTELPKPLADEFRRAYDQHSLGQSLEDALRDMAVSIDSTDFAFFVTAVLIQRQTGGDLAEVLNNISAMIRQRVRLLQHVKAKTAEGRFTGYILVAFPILMFFISWFMSPKQANVLLHTGTGQKLLAVAAGLVTCGLWAIRRITTVRV